jgi:hypothetical protein
MAIELTDAGTLHLAVSLGTATRGTALTRILAHRTSPGWIVGPSMAVREWRFEGIVEHDGKVFLVGPHVAGPSLKQVLELTREEALPMLHLLGRAVLRLSESDAGWFPLQSDSVIFTDAGDILFLPPDVDRELRDLRIFDANRETFECLNHPDLRGAPRDAFGMAAALYRVFTGRFPFWGADAADLHEQVRSLEIQPPAGLVPGLSLDVSDTIMAGLGRGRGGTISVEEISAEISRWLTRDLVQPLTEEQRKNARAAAGAREASAGRSFQRRRFWQRNWRVAGIVAVIVIALGAVGGTVLKNVLAPRVTRGYPPRRVVETFYTSMNTLDQATMQSCVVGKAGQGEIDQTMTLYVTSRVTQGYEGRSNLVSAADWDKSGRPPLRAPRILYGVTGLSLGEEHAEPAPVFLVKYDMWNPAPAPETMDVNAAPQSEGHAITERVWMKSDKGDWVIYRFDRLDAVPLTPPKVDTSPPPGQPVPGLPQKP